MSTTLEMLPQAIAAAEARPRRRVKADMVIGTRMKDQEVLESALDAAGIKRRFYEGMLYAETRDERTLFGFIQESDGVFDAHFVHDEDPANAQRLVDATTHEYNRLVQQHVHDRVVAHARDQGLVFHSEYVEDDNTIVVTLEVQE
jgi:hypothetical protein